MSERYITGGGPRNSGDALTCSVVMRPLSPVARKPLILAAAGRSIILETGLKCVLEL